MELNFWEIICYSYLVAKLNCAAKVAFNILLETMPKVDNKMEKAPEKSENSEKLEILEKVDKNGIDIEKFEKLNKPTVRFTGDSETTELEDPFCNPKNPHIITFHDITSAAFKIKSGIEVTPCPVSIFFHSK